LRYLFGDEMSISGKLYFDGAWHQGMGGTYHAVNPATAQTLEPAMTKALKKTSAPAR
jgi:hypothetical protein